MALKFYFDTHIAKAAAVQLREKGVNVVRCEEVGMAEASDEEHLQYATDNGYVMVSQDKDFPALNTQWQKTKRSHAGIMKLPPDIKGGALISYVANELFFYHEADIANAVDYQTEIWNTLIYL